MSFHEQQLTRQQRNDFGWLPLIFSLYISPDDARLNPAWQWNTPRWIQIQSQKKDNQKLINKLIKNKQKKQKKQTNKIKEKVLLHKRKDIATKIHINFIQTCGMIKNN